MTQLPRQETLLTDEAKLPVCLRYVPVDAKRAGVLTACQCDFGRSVLMASGSSSALVLMVVVPMRHSVLLMPSALESRMSPCWDCSFVSEADFVPLLSNITSCTILPMSTAVSHCSVSLAAAMLGCEVLGSYRGLCLCLDLHSLDKYTMAN